MANDSGQTPRESTGGFEKRGGYTGNQDPGQPTGLMQQQTVPVNQQQGQPQQSAGSNSAGSPQSNSDS